MELARLRETAAVLARVLDEQVQGMQQGLMTSILLAVAFFHLYTHYPEPESSPARHYPLLLGLFLASLLVAGGLVWRVWWLRLDTRRLDYRALAEALRVRLFWGLAGLTESVADSYLDQVRGEMAWARRALLHVSPPPAHWGEDFAVASPQEKLIRLAAARHWWSREQKHYFQKAHSTQHKGAVRCRRYGLLLAAAGWFIAAFLLFHRCGLDPEAARAGTAAAHATHPLWCARHPEHWIVILSGMLAAGGGLWIAYGERRCFEELAQQYERLHVVFERGDLVLQAHLRELTVHRRQGNGPAQAQAIEQSHAVLCALGREAITEHAQWLILRRARPFELHIG